VGEQQPGEVDGEVEIGDQDSLDLLTRLQRAAELIGKYKTSLKRFSKPGGGLSPRQEGSNGGKAGGSMGLTGSVLGLRPGVQQLHEELQQRW
jgi:hypothetical protein